MTKEEWCAENPMLCDEEGEYLYDDKPWEGSDEELSQSEIEQAQRDSDFAFESQEVWAKAWDAAIVAGKSKDEAEDIAYAAYWKVEKKYFPNEYEEQHSDASHDYSIEEIPF